MQWLILLPLLAFAAPLQASKDRSVWFWQDSGSSWGSSVIFGNNTLENKTIAFFKAHSIKRVYGSYGNRPASEPTTIAQWNTKLHAQGIQSQCLLRCAQRSSREGDSVEAPLLSGHFQDPQAGDKKLDEDREMNLLEGRDGLRGELVGDSMQPVLPAP